MFEDTWGHFPFHTERAFLHQPSLWTFKKGGGEWAREGGKGGGFASTENCRSSDIRIERDDGQPGGRSFFKKEGRSWEEEGTGNMLLLFQGKHASLHVEHLPAVRENFISIF